MDKIKTILVYERKITFFIIFKTEMKISCVLIPKKITNKSTQAFLFLSTNAYLMNLQGKRHIFKKNKNYLLRKHVYFVS